MVEDAWDKIAEDRIAEDKIADSAVDREAEVVEGTWTGWEGSRVTTGNASLEQRKLSA